MKRNLMLICSMVLFVLSCSFQPSENTGPAQSNLDNGTTGQVQFEFQNKTAGTRNSIQDAHAVIVTIVNENNKPVYELKKLDLVNMNGYLITQPISLPVGAYRLTQFIVIDGGEKALFATPLLDSPLAYLVNEPLAIDFSLNKDRVLKLTPEVIDLEEIVPTDVGYNTFSFEIIDTVEILASAFIYNEDIKNYQLTDTSIDIYAGDAKIFTGNLEDKTNVLIINAAHSDYTLVINKTGYIEWSKTLTGEELKNYRDTPLICCLEQKKEVLEGLVAYYPFNGNANDESGYGNHGTVYGATLTDDRNGKAASAYYFDGNKDYIKCKNNVLSIRESITVCVWLKNNDISFSDGYSNYIISKAVYGYTPYTDYCLSILNHRYGFNIQTSSGYYSATTSNTFNNNQTDFITGTYNYQTGKLKIYVNGKLEGSTNATGKITHSNNEFYIGDWDGDSIWHYTNGIIDEVRIYNRALSDEEILILFNLKY